MGKTPETLTAAQRAAALGMQAVQAAKTGTSAADRTAAYAEKAKESLMPQPSGAPPRLRLDAGGTAARPYEEPIDPQQEFDDSLSALHIQDLEVYGFNTRLRPNPRYHDIKASIRAHGIYNTLTVTRPPGARRYHPYGGGNTRLQIAQELHREGDMRFATLNVTIKRWPGHSQVLAAHMGENDNRGDTTFWEKANAVARFRAEFERETSRVLTVANLSDELRNAGLQYGPRLVNSFDFAVSHLKAVGPWLSAAVVVDSLRPAWQTCHALAKVLDIRDANKVLAQVLDEFGQHLQTQQDRRAQDGVEQQSIESVLEPAELIRAWHQGLASQHSVPADRLTSMVAMLAADRTATKEQLLREPAPSTSPAPGTEPSHSAAGDAAAPASPMPQIPLPGMLAGVGAASPAAGDPPVAQASGAVPHGQLPIAPTKEQVRREVLAAAAELGAMARLEDCLGLCDGLPFGFFVDLPAQPHQVGEEVLSDHTMVQVRMAVWKFMAAISHQMTPDYLSLLPESSTWRQAAESGSDGFASRYEAAIGGGMDDTGQPAIRLGEVGALFTLPRTRDSLIRLLGAMRDMPLA